MSFADFRRSLGDAAVPPPGIEGALLALWHEGRGEWDQAHSVAQQSDDSESAWVHAYLHRKEGDVSNAGYWYARAARPAASGDLAVEWENLVRALLSH